MNRPENDLEALRQDLRAAYNGQPWHGLSIIDVLKGVDAQTAARKSIPGAHTIWELVLHMAVWTRETTSRVSGNAPKSPDEDWPVPDVSGGEEAWAAARLELNTAQHELERLVDTLRADDLLRWIGDQRDPALGAGVTVGTLVRGLMQHDAYHEGQIALLKRAAGPTRSG